MNPPWSRAMPWASNTRALEATLSAAAGAANEKTREGRVFLVVRCFYRGLERVDDEPPGSVMVTVGGRTIA